MDADEKLQMINLGDATVETRQVSLYPMVYPDSVFGRGSVPDWD